MTSFLDDVGSYISTKTILVIVILIKCSFKKKLVSVTLIVLSQAYLLCSITQTVFQDTSLNLLLVKAYVNDSSDISHSGPLHENRRLKRGHAGDSLHHFNKYLT